MEGLLQNFEKFLKTLVTTLLKYIDTMTYIRYVHACVVLCTYAYACKHYVYTFMCIYVPCCTALQYPSSTNECALGHFLPLAQFAVFFGQIFKAL